MIPCLLAVGALLAPVAASAAKPPKPPKLPPGQQGVTIKPSAPLITFSHPVVTTVSVKRAKAGTGVTLQRRATTSPTWSDAETKLTGPNGDASFTTRPRVNTIYRAIAHTTPEQTSPEATVLVAPLVGFHVSDSTPHAGQRIRFAGTVRPRHNGRRVAIQRRSATGTWVTVKRARLRAATATYSKYAARVRVRRTGTYRVRLAAHADHAAAVSRERTLTVA